MRYMLSLSDEELKGEDKKTMIEIGVCINGLLRLVEVYIQNYITLLF